MESNRRSKYAKWLVSGTSYLYIKNFLDKQEKSYVEGKVKNTSEKVKYKSF